MAAISKKIAHRVSGEQAQGRPVEWSGGPMWGRKGKGKWAGGKAEEGGEAQLCISAKRGPPISINCVTHLGFVSITKDAFVSSGLRFLPILGNSLTEVCARSDMEQGAAGHSARSLGPLPGAELAPQRFWSRPTGRVPWWPTRASSSVVAGLVIRDTAPKTQYCCPQGLETNNTPPLRREIEHPNGRGVGEKGSERTSAVSAPGPASAQQPKLERQSFVSWTCYY
ncbi:hypothetical protein EDB80DRAFT_839116 [Ilyonectria destructans]|nr:hypothetical protein EDB80DRAFT_839116 [Ilyonectria destructans]